MFYEHNTVTGRLASTEKLRTPSKLVLAPEGPTVVYSAGTTFPKDVPARKGNYGELPEFLAKKMKHFQSPSGIPIHLKGGPVDKVLFGATMVICGVGVFGCLQFIYDMAFPKKKEE